MTTIRTASEVAPRDFAENLPGEWSVDSFPAEFVTVMRTALALGQIPILYIDEESHLITLGAIANVLAVDA